MADLFSAMQTFALQAGTAKVPVEATPRPIGGAVANHVHLDPPIYGENIFGDFVYVNGAVPKAADPSWSAETPKAVSRATSGFGADVSVDYSLPAGARWEGHGIFGGRVEPGGYAISRYGTPVSGFGAAAPVSPNVPKPIMPAATKAAPVPTATGPMAPKAPSAQALALQLATMLKGVPAGALAAQLATALKAGPGAASFTILTPPPATTQALAPAAPVIAPLRSASAPSLPPPPPNVAQIQVPTAKVKPGTIKAYRPISGFGADPPATTAPTTTPAPVPPSTPLFAALQFAKANPAVTAVGIIGLVAAVAYVTSNA